MTHFGVLTFTALALLSLSPRARADEPCSELASAVDLSSSPSDDRRVFCQFAKDTVAGGCCQSSLYNCLKAHPTCARGLVLADIGRGTISTGAAEEKAVAAAAAYEDGFGADKRSAIDTSKAPCQGAKAGATPTVTLEEFSDFDCPHCAAAEPVLEKLLTQDKNVRLCSFMFPLPGHRFSQFASAAALYAQSQNKFWPMADALFATQEQREGADEAGYKAQLVHVGQNVGLDPAGLTAALKSDSPFMDRVKDQQMLGISLLLQGTPSFFVEGHAMNGVPLADLAAAVRDERDSKSKR